MSLEQLSVGTAGLIAVLGYGVVFFGLVLLMVVIWILGKVMVASAKKQAPVAAPAAPAAPAEEPKPIGSAGQVALYDVPDREAAMIMAIVAEKLQKPLNELRFISIKEVTKP